MNQNIATINNEFKGNFSKWIVIENTVKKDYYLYQAGFILYGTDTESVRSRYRGKFSTVPIEKKSVPWKIFDGTDFFYGTDCFFYGTDLKKKKSVTRH